MKWTASKVKALKGEQKISMVTAYDALSARLVDQAGIPCVLVGDSLANTALGYENTLPVTIEEMLHHTRAVKRGTQEALIVADLPFMSYQISHEQGLQNAGRFLKEAGADAVKIEGGEMRVPLIKALVANGIPVVGHIGLTPQSVKEMGYKVQGRAAEEAAQLLADQCPDTDRRNCHRTEDNHQYQDGGQAACGRVHRYRRQANRPGLGVYPLK